MIKLKEETKNAFYNLLKAISVNEFQQINEKDTDGCTILHRAAQVSEPEIVELLIKKGANVNERNNRNETPLHLAAFLGRRKNVRALIKNGGEVNARSNNKAVPLHLASLAGRIRTIEELINAGGDMNAIDRFECSPLNYAKIYPRVTSYLEKKGVNMRDVEVMYGEANKAIEEIMERCNKGPEGEVMSFKEVVELIEKESLYQLSQITRQIIHRANGFDRTFRNISNKFRYSIFGSVK